MAIIKGQETQIMVGSEALFKHEKSSGFNLNANTADVSSKSDANPMYDHNEFTNYSFSASGEGILDNDEELGNLIALALTENAHGITVDGKSGNAFVESADFDFPADGNATASISFTGTGALS